jgi:predicted transposase/invertase (TIGR01784 family)
VGGLRGVQEQAVKGKGWQYELKGVYTIAILDFEFDDNADKFQSYVKLMDVDTQAVFYDKLTFVYLEMPKFTKTEEELESHFDKWLYVIRNLHHLESMPARIQEKIFAQLFEQAEIAKYAPQERRAYEDSKKHYLDLKNALDTSFRQGKEEGIEEGIEIGIEKGIEKGKMERAIEIALEMLQNNEPIEKIMKYTGLSKTEIEKLR